MKAIFAISSLLSLLSACSSKISSGSCSASVSTETKGTESGLPGGYLHFGSKACTASFSYFKEGSLYKAQVFSARHCSPETASDHASQVQVTADLYFDGGYFQKLPVEETFVKARNSALKELGELPNPALAKPLVEALNTITGLKFNWCFPDSPAPADESLSLTSEPSTRRLCWSVMDVGMFEVTFPESTFDQGANADLKRHLDVEIAKRTTKVADTAANLTRIVPLRNSDVDPQILIDGNFSWKTQITALQNDLILFTGTTRLSSYAGFIDWARKCSLPASYPREPEDFAESCGAREELLQIAKKYFTDADHVDAQGKLQRANIFDLAQAAGYGPDTPFDRTHGIDGFRPEINRKSEKIAFDLDARSRSFTDKLAAKMGGLTVHANLKTTQVPSGVAGIPNASNVKTQTDFKAFPLSSVRLSAVSPVLEKIGVGALVAKMNFPVADEAVHFLPGDSGTLLLIGDSVPFMTLNGVDDDFTSGGASVSPLPVPRSRRSGSVPNAAEAPKSSTTGSKEGKGDCQ